MRHRIHEPASTRRFKCLREKPHGTRAPRVFRGSYRDLTRVAHLNPGMWAELTMDDAKNLSQEIASLIEALDAYRLALDAGDRDRLRMLLSLKATASSARSMTRR